jgi:DNA-binding PucR family transcriptional regulator
VASALEPPAPSVTSPEVRRLAAEWQRELATIADDMYAFLAERIPAARTEELASLTLASCSANTEAALSMIRSGIPAAATEAPVAALEHARRMAARPGGLDELLRFYRMGHAFFWNRFSSALVEAVPDRDRLVVALEEFSAFVFEYIDAISARVAAEHIAERERRQRRAAIVRADVVRALLAGEAVDQRAAERALGYVLDGPQLAFVCWTSGEPSGLERVAAAVGRTLGRGRPLLVEDGPDAIGGWVRLQDGGRDDEDAPRAAVAAALDELGEPVHVAIGRPGAGVEGFRSSRAQADRARRVVTLAGTIAPSLTPFATIELVDLLSADIDAARAFVTHQLGGLAGRSAAAARAREAMLLIVAPGGGIADAARQLGLHRNTVLQRLRRGGELRGRSIEDGPRELYAALLLAAVLPGQVLTE